ncbi:hypothetical protein AAFF_G00012870 [Aldrovandia affinis]|uniref:Uncharacterized protein n=1 Tax=Aldrovandia affinis TaxID=143900 RepID=A0AAD7S6P8_9TELE|nr:hypothetical protein AAFF_G00012870 [Aldrovandia affinis]
MRSSPPDWMKAAPPSTPACRRLAAPSPRPPAAVGTLFQLPLSHRSIRLSSWALFRYTTPTPAPRPNWSISSSQARAKVKSNRSRFQPRVDLAEGVPEFAVRATPVGGGFQRRPACAFARASPAEGEASGGEFVSAGSERVARARLRSPGRGVSVCLCEEEEEEEAVSSGCGEVHLPFLRTPPRRCPHASFSLRRTRQNVPLKRGEIGGSPQPRRNPRPFRWSVLLMAPDAGSGPRARKSFHFE